MARRRPADKDYAASDERMNPVRQGQARTQMFGSGHAFWPTAIKMAQETATVGQILDAARRSGFGDLTYTQIKIGLYRAPADLNIPSPVAGFMRRRYEKLLEGFDAIAKAKASVLEAERTLAEIVDELANLASDDESIYVRDRVTILEAQRAEWWQRWHTSTRALIELDLKMNPPALPTSEERTTIGLEPNAAAPDSVEERINFRIEEFLREIPNPPTEDLARIFGAENIRSPEQLPEDEEAPMETHAAGEPSLQLMLPLDA